MMVAPARERGLKYEVATALATLMEVAPARERGLKLKYRPETPLLQCRSREGAWIEISLLSNII